MTSADLWFGRSHAERLARAALTPASWLYALGWRAYASLYDSGLKRAAEPHSPVVCVGNLVVGGSGKTPFTLFVSDVIASLGWPVVIGCSGYGSPAEEAARIAPAGMLDAAEWGDEPAMIRMLRPNLPLIVGRRRVLAAELCHASFPDAVLLMDDGFQHLPLVKHLSIVLDDPAPINGRCLPAGPYREPRGDRHKADLLIPDDCGIGRSPVRLESTEGEVAEVGDYAVLCAIGSPQRFLAELEAALPPKSRRVAEQLLPDHDPLREGNLLDAFPPDVPVVVTAKDWVKLRARADVGTRRFLVAKQDVWAEPAEDFQAWIRARLHECSTSSPPG